jgi:hypothetical protein
LGPGWLTGDVRLTKGFAGHLDSDRVLGWPESAVFKKLDVSRGHAAKSRTTFEQLLARFICALAGGTLPHFVRFLAAPRASRSRTHRHRQRSTPGVVVRVRNARGFVLFHVERV